MKGPGAVSGGAESCVSHQDSQAAMQYNYDLALSITSLILRNTMGASRSPSTFLTKPTQQPWSDFWDHTRGTFVMCIDELEVIMENLQACLNLVRVVFEQKGSIGLQLKEKNAVGFHYLNEN